MKTKVLFIWLTGLLLAPFFLVSDIHVQQASAQREDMITSDLILDLKLAQQNPASDQKAILNAEIKQAVIVTNSGDVNTVKPQDILLPKVKTEHADVADHPDQTTSEQVVSTPIEVEVTVTPEETDQNQPETTPENETHESTAPSIESEKILKPSSTELNPNEGVMPTESTGDLVPGTSVLFPDDNAAPLDNSANPHEAAPTSVYQIPSFEQPTNQPGTTENTQPTNVTGPPSTTDNSQPTAVPSDNGAINQLQQPTSPPAANDNSAVQQTQPPNNNPPPASDNSQPQSNPPSNDSGSSNQPSSDTNSNSTVQGIQTGPVNFFQQIMNILFFWRK